MPISFTVQVDQIYFRRDEERGEDGAVYYLILTPCTERPCRHICVTHPRMAHHYERQAFRRGASGYRLDATTEEIANDRANVWGWDGDRDAPTVLPSFLALDVKNGKRLRPYRMHSFLRAGRIELCGDSTVMLHPSPTACVDADDWKIRPRSGQRSQSSSAPAARRSRRGSKGA